MNRSDEPAPKSTPKRFNPFLARSRALGSSGTSGLEATTIGFTLVGFIVAGAGLGWVLDNHFGTSYWLPILFLVGVAGGFREMMVVLKRVGEAQAADKLRRANEQRARQATVKPTDNPTPGQLAARKRMFEVPPPPFEQAAQNVADEKAPGEQVEVENVLEQMLAQGDLSAEELKELGFDVELPADDGDR